MPLLVVDYDQGKAEYADSVWRVGSIWAKIKGKFGEMLGIIKFVTTILRKKDG